MVVSCLLFIPRRVLFLVLCVVRCLSVVCCWLLIRLRCSLFIVVFVGASRVFVVCCCLLFVVLCLLCVWFVVCCLLCVVGCVLVVARCSALVLVVCRV